MENANPKKYILHAAELMLQWRLEC